MKKNQFRVASALIAGLMLVTALPGCDQHSATAPKDASTARSATVSSAPQPTHAGFNITGHALNLKDGTRVTLLEMDAHPNQMDSSKKLASVQVEHGNFSMTGSVDEPRRGVLSWGSHTSVGMILENAKYQVVDTGAGLVVEGGHYNNLANSYQWTPAYVAALKNQHKTCNKAFAGVNQMDEAAMDAARKTCAPSQNATRKIQNEYQARVLDGDSPTLLKLFVLPENYDWKRYDVAARKAMYAAYAKQLGENPVLQRIHYEASQQQKNEAAGDALAVGKPYRDIVAVDADGKQVKLSDVLAKNKMVLVDFWASWCGPCRGEFPHLAKTYKEFHKDGFEIYAVSLDDKRKDWLKALKEEGVNNNIPWINLRDAGIDAKSATAYGVQGLPSNFLISGDGKIVGKNMQDWGVERAVRSQFGKLGHGKG